MAVKILLVEDDFDIAKVLSDYLVDVGYEVSWASTGKEGWEEFYQGGYELILVDLMMPEMDGYNLCRHIRLQSDVPIIIISAKEESQDKIKGLNIGADDYITKPFSLEEVLARIQSQLRRYQRYRMTASVNEETVYYIENLQVYPDKQFAVLGEIEIKLTPKEFDILLLLAKHPGRVFSKQEIYEHIWQRDIINGEQNVTVHVRSLRQKLGDDIRKPRYIETAWGTGYRSPGKMR
ncbi:response regulator transcription factor [Dethiobacter alkaliphilus]|uniref:response regulator transcription factor n=1 Tax=Dethiobacter alkaliphilus TaxID=427926 RepID=UPI002226628F|nr:response regulator transcription factor [Dethiobacter alkaliphilus]MCW3490389.1 response regulator transcription factor [Dethiobacter alkaliphilus]